MIENLPGEAHGLSFTTSESSAAWLKSSDLVVASRCEGEGDVVSLFSRKLKPHSKQNAWFS